MKLCDVKRVLTVKSIRSREKDSHNGNTNEDNMGVPSTAVPKIFASLPTPRLSFGIYYKEF